MKKRIACAVLCGWLLAAPSLHAQEAPVSAEFRADVERLLEVTHALDLGKQFASAITVQMVASVRQNRPDLPQAALDALPQAIAETIEENSAPLREGLVALYAKHFTQAEVRGMLEFYETDLGRKTIQVMPQLMQDSMALGMQWGQSLSSQLGTKVAEKLRARGIAI